MNDRLLAAAEDGSSIVTASRRLARSLLRDYEHRMQAVGQRAWRTPAIQPYSRWLRDTLEVLSDGDQPYCASSAQSRILWEDCVRGELGEARPQLGQVVRTAIDAWALIHDFRVPFEEIQRTIDSQDQRVFARAMLRYKDRLRALGWLDSAELAGALVEALGKAGSMAGDRILFAGFDRLTPSQHLVIKQLRVAGAVVGIEAYGPSQPIEVIGFESCDSEWRSAGAWARERLLAEPGERVAIIVSGLERDPERVGRRVREGFVPGWQTGTVSAGQAVNVSLGKTLDVYPLTAVALLVIRWLHAPLTSRELGVLLRCSFIGVESGGARARLENDLRKVAARDWTPGRARRVLSAGEPEPDVADLLGRVTALEELLGEQPASATPTYWARTFERALDRLGWPGSTPLDSLEHQLRNRWRELLGEFAALESVTGHLSLAAAADRLRQLARESVFQPEAVSATLNVLGPLEASGLEFDAVWVAGLTADAWPGPGGATPLVSRRLQRQYGMPDATPEDTHDFALKVLTRIGASAPTVVGSYARMDGDSEQGPSLLDNVEPSARCVADPGWHARLWCSERRIVDVEHEGVPRVESGEKIRGGSGTINLQISEPFAAFARGRLGITTLDPFAEGLTPMLRGNLLHDALSFLYAERPTQAQILDWDDATLETRSTDAARRAVRRYRFAAGATLTRLLDFEERRIEQLLKDVVALDRQRIPFRVASVEGTSSGTVGGIDLDLRHDRIDQAPDGSIIILDYKTGAPRRFLSRGEPTDYQLVVYAATAPGPVSGMGFYNVDRRAVEISGAGSTLSGDTSIEGELASWIDVVGNAARMLRAGDTRVNSAQPAEDARRHALISRFQELVRDV